MDKETRPPVDRIRAKVNAFLRARDAAGREHEHRSLRQLAREIGMSPTGLKKFADGASPYAPTLQALTTWHTALIETERDGMAGHRIRLVAELFPAEHRQAVESDLWTFYHDLCTRYPEKPRRPSRPRRAPAPRMDICRQCGAEVPLGELRKHLQERHGGAAPVWPGGAPPPLTPPHS